MRDPTLVLKFGGSVLDDDASIERAVHEVYRYTRRGIRIVAVVSARHGQTDRLFAAGRAQGLEGHALAAFVAGGEQESAARLRDALQRAGVPARALAPEELGLEASGDPFDSSLARIDGQGLAAALASGEVLVAPGFVAPVTRTRDDGEHTEYCLLGRGGSDLTALAIAFALRARCRLLKDVDGLYESDPAKARSRNRRFTRITFARARELDARIIARQALDFAAARGIRFEIAGLGAPDATTVGADVDRFHPERQRKRRTRVAVLGAGTVGSELIEHLRALDDQFEIASILVRDPLRPDRARSGLPYTADPEAALDCGAEIFLELLGGERPAVALLHGALERGAHVVTANKSVLARRGKELFAAAKSGDRRILASACVGGAVPLLETAWRLRGKLVRIAAVINGTTNFVLDSLTADPALDLPSVLHRARSLGLCEPDPRRDLSGEDAAEKLVVLAQTLGDPKLTLDRIDLRSAGSDLVAEVRDARTRGVVPRQIATLERRGSEWTGRVALETVGPESSLAHCHGAENSARFDLVDGTSRIVQGTGAGPRPTVEALLADLFEITRKRRSARLPRGHRNRSAAPLRDSA